MLIGIMSDSHGHAKRVRRAVELFRGLEVEHVIHCGDIGGVSVLEELVGWPCTMVWGNTDVPAGDVFGFAAGAGLAVPVGGPAMVTLGGKSMAVFHGHERGFAAACDVMDVDYLFHGHTHERRDERIGKTRVINPGALCRAKPKTVATLRTVTDELEYHEIEK